MSSPLKGKPVRANFTPPPVLTDTSEWHARRQKEFGIKSRSRLWRLQVFAICFPLAGIGGGVGMEIGDDIFRRHWSDLLVTTGIAALFIVPLIILCLIIWKNVWNNRPSGYAFHASKTVWKILLIGSFVAGLVMGGILPWTPKK